MRRQDLSVAAEVDAEHDVQEWVKPVVAGEWAAMKAALERRHGIMKDKVMLRGEETRRG